MHCKNKYVPNIYGRPIFGSAFKNIETDIEIHTRNYATIQNDFVGSVMLSYPNPDLSDEQKDDIVNGVKDKFTGSDNAGNIVFSFGEDVKVERLQPEKVGDQYTALIKTNTEAIYASMRIIPQLFGVVVEGSGFNREEFSESFAVLNATMIRPIQNEFIRFWERITGKGTITIQPFNID